MRELCDIEDIVVLLENILEIKNKKDNEILYSKEETNEERNWNSKEAW